LYPEETLLENDPLRGVLWGPTDEDGEEGRWSRAWFDWRAGESNKDQPDFHIKPVVALSATARRDASAS
jgi:hypothetical protein